MQYGALPSMNALFSTYKPFLALVLGQRCAACEAPCIDTPVCESCTQKVAYSGTRHVRCQQCASPLIEATHNYQLGQYSLCGQCSGHAPAFDAAVCVGSFSEPLGQLISQFKFSHHLVLARWFATQLQPQLITLENQSPQPFDLIVPIPLHPQRLRERGFNQAWEIIRHLAYPAQQKCHLLERLRDTPSQRNMTAVQRLANVKQAFGIADNSFQTPYSTLPNVLAQPLMGKHIVLLDDVVTTTATMQSASLALKAAGASRVSLACIARVSH
jgi:ComF family protein